MVETGPGGDLTVAWPNPVSAINRTVPLVGADPAGSFEPIHTRQANVNLDGLSAPGSLTSTCRISARESGLADHCG